MALSGSAAHAIFQKSLEILMGRVAPVEITTFSFREFLAKNNITDSSLHASLLGIQKDFENSLSPSLLHSRLKSDLGSLNPKAFRIYITDFLQAGGFPQI